jgi:pyruvate/2-oxoglutarate dehydrogenase complex dihydrolipoamide acyltransferase (E2) component
VFAKAGDVLASGAPFLRIETSDTSLRHLESRAASTAAVGAAPVAQRPALVWTPRASKLAQEAGLDPATIVAIEATGPGGRVSGDDVTRYLAARKS